MDPQLITKLERLLGGNASDEAAILAFIKHRYSVDALFKIPDPIAQEILKRPYDFLRKAREYHNPQLSL